MPRLQRFKPELAVKEFVALVKEKLAERGITVTQLAAKTGLSRQHIYNILNGEQTPTLSTASAIAHELGLEIKTVEAI